MICGAICVSYQTIWSVNKHDQQFASQCRFLFQFVTLQWHHMGITASKITCNYIIYSTAVENAKATNYWPFVRGTHRWFPQTKGQCSPCQSFFRLTTKENTLNSELLTFYEGDHRWPIDSPHNGPHIRHVAGCACTGNAFPTTDFKGNS